MQSIILSINTATREEFPRLAIEMGAAIREKELSISLGGVGGGCALPLQKKSVFLPILFPQQPNPMNNRLKIWINLALVCIVSVAAIVWAMPRESKFGYTYDIGQPWSYAPLIATFEFPIEKSAEQVKAERDSAMKSFYPYYKLNPQVGVQQIKNFRADYAQGKMEGVPNAYVQHAINLLEDVYASGVVELDNMNRLVNDGHGGVRVIDGREATVRTLANIYSPRSAYQYLMHQEEYSREVMARLDLPNYLSANLLYDSIKTHEERDELLSSITTHTGMVLAGERIIDRGERVSPRQYSILESLRRIAEERKSSNADVLLILGGQVGLVVTFVLLLCNFLHMYRRDIFESMQSIYLIFSLLTAFAVVSSLMLNYKFFSVYIIPFTMVPIIVRIFKDTRTAFTVHVVMVCICSIPLHMNYQFMLTQLVSGIVALFTIKELTSRGQILRTAFVVTMVTMAFGFFLELAQGHGLHDLDRSWYWYVGINGVALLFTYPLLYLIEQMFGFTSSVTLIEMSNVNTPLIRRMAKEAQGTFVHSLQVGNLAAEVAAAIGARVQLVRTAALYHDIGKMLNPAYFTENQGALNPHDQLSEERSAEIIISHVTEGLRLAEMHGIPRLIREFIPTHHGRSMVKYFYIQACNKHGQENVDPEAFTYPGRNPFTREQAILMMADAIEASSRSLPEYNEETITSLVNRIIDSQVEGGYFRECPITFKDIADAKRVFAESLKTVYHTRIAYPTLDRAKKAEDETPKDKASFYGNTWKWKK